MDREGFAKVSRWHLASMFLLSKVFAYLIYQYSGWHHHTWPMPEGQDGNVRFCESFAKVPHESGESRGLDLKGRALSHSLSLTPSLCLCLLVSLSLSLSLFLFLSLNGLVIRKFKKHVQRWFRESFAKVFFSREDGHFGNKEFWTAPI